MRPWLLVTLALFAGATRGAELGVVTLVDGSPRLLRGATWYKLVPGTRVDDADIVDTRERGQVQVEFARGSLVNLVDGIIYIVPLAAKESLQVITLEIPRGWIKAVAKSPGVRLRVAAAEVSVVGALVMTTDGTRLEAFVEAGGARFEASATGGSAATRHDAKQDEYWSKSASGTFVPSTRPPKAFIDSMPRHFADPLPGFAGRFTTKAALIPDREIVYAEARPWLAGRDRAVFERRFAVRLADPAFRKAVEPDVGRYPAWDRRLHPEKYAPASVGKPVPPQ